MINKPVLISLSLFTALMLGWTAAASENDCSAFVDSSGFSSLSQWQPESAEAFFPQAPSYIEDQVLVMEEAFREGNHEALAKAYLELKRTLLTHLNRFGDHEIRPWLASFVRDLSEDYKPTVMSNASTFEAMEAKMNAAAPIVGEDTRAQEFLQVCCSLANSIRPYEELMEISALNQALFDNFIEGIRDNLLGHISFQTYKPYVTSSDPSSNRPQDKPICTSCLSRLGHLPNDQ